MKPIRIGMLVCVILISAVISIHYNSINRPDQTRNEIDTIENITSLGNGTSNITLNTTLPEGIDKMKAYEIVAPIYNLSYCKEVIEKTYPNWLDNGTDIQEAKDNNSTLFLKNGETIRIRKNGCLEYTNKMAQEKWDKLAMAALEEGSASPSNNNSINSSSGRSGDNSTDIIKNDDNSTEGDGSQSENNAGNESLSGSTKINRTEKKLDGQISKDEAYNKTFEYIKSHGGFPKAYFLSSSVWGEISNDDFSIVRSYVFHFDRKIDGYPMVGRNGEGANAIITPLGEIYIYRVLWREISDSFKNVSVNNASVAFGLLKEKVHINRTISKVEVGYYSNKYSEPQENLMPVWIFYYNEKCTQYMCVDAVELKFID